MIRSLGIALVLVLVLSVAMTMVASAGTVVGTSMENAALISCTQTYGGTMMKGEHAWAKYYPSTGRTTGVNMTFGPVPDAEPKDTSFFKVWTYVPRPLGPTLTELGRGTAPGSFTNLKTWRGSGYNGVHYIEVVNTNDGPTDFTLYLNCQWPIR